MKTKEGQLPHLLRETARRLDEGARYEWGHMGRCNCGHLVQTVTELTDTQIVEAADHDMEEWSEHAKTYCENTGASVDSLFLALARVGFSHQDVMRLEYLSDPRVHRQLGPDGERLRRNFAPDVSLYMKTLADVIEEEQQQRSEPSLHLCPS